MTMEKREHWSTNELAIAVAKSVADKCHGDRPSGVAPERYAIIYQAAGMGAFLVMQEIRANMFGGAE